MRDARQSRAGIVRRGLCLPLVLVASLLVAGGVATAASASPPVRSAMDVYFRGTTIRGCVTGAGVLTLRMRHATCPKGQTPITWTRRGIAGRRGATGPRGLAGATGDPGQGGSGMGATGPKGDDGAQGAGGQDGSPGPPGGDGPPGPDGSLTGPAGGALSGTYPDPTLAVTGGPCATGQFLADISSLAELTCGPADSNTALGLDSMQSITTGTENVATGHTALSSNTVGSGNVASGSGALAGNSSGSNNSAFGTGALEANATGDRNVASGLNALFSNTTGTGNVASGSGTLFSNTIGDANVAVGPDALSANTRGRGNVASGELAMFSNTTGGDNVASGGASLYSNIDGSNNIATGGSAIFSNTSGNDNVGTGANSLVSNTTGSQNVALGSGALQNNETGGGNIGVGEGSGRRLTTGDSNIDIGNPGVADEAHTIRIGTNTIHTDGTYLAGVFGGAADPATQVGVTVDADGRLGTVLSSRRFKTSIHPLGSLGGRLMKLRPVSFLYKKKFGGNSTRRQYGLIADEVAKVFPNLVVRDKQGKPLTVAYQQLPSLLLAQLQIEHAHAKRQQRQINRLARQVHRLAKRR